MKRINYIVLFCFILIAKHASAQVPIVQKIEPLRTFPGDTIVISGSGFHDDKTNLEVWFDNVSGEIVKSSIYGIEVIVPFQARACNIEVVNKISRLSGKSLTKFTPNFNGATFSTANFSGEKLFTANEELWDLCDCDFDGDGKPDVAASKFTRPQTVFDPPTDLMLLQNTSTPGNLNFTKLDKSNLSVLNLTFPTDNVICGDLQGDGKPELIATRAGSPRNSVHIFKNTGSPGTISFASPLSLFMSESNYFATRMALRDLNKDGKPEIIVTNSFNDIFYVFINASSGGNLSFTSTPLKLSIELSETEELKTYETDVQDFNGDGLPDIIINQFQTRDIFLLKNISEGSIAFAAPQKITMPGNFNRIASADFNNDGLLDLVFTNTILNRLDVIVNQSTTTTFAFSAPIELSTSPEPWGIDVADIDGDNDSDIIVANKYAQTTGITDFNIDVFLNNSTNPLTFTRQSVHANQPTRNVKVNDFDGDGKPDISYTGFNETTQISQLVVTRNTNCHQAKILNEETSFCNGRTVRIQAIPAGNVTFAWEKDGVAFGSNEAFIDITDAATYKVTVTGENGTCTTTDQITMTKSAQLAPATPVITSGSPVCAGSSLTLSSNSAGPTYSWTGPNGFTSSSASPVINTITIEQAGIYSLQVTAANGCTSDVATSRVDVSDLSDFQISSPVSGPLCEGNTVTLSVNNPPNHSFQWKKDGSPISGETSSTISVNSDGSYTVFVSNDDLTNCTTETLPSVVEILAKPVADFNADLTGCKGIAVSFTDNSSVDERATPTYSWNFGDTQTSTDQNTSHSYANAGSFNVTLTVQYTGVSNCSNNVTKPLAVVNPTLPDITASAESACPDGEVQLSLTGTFASVTWSTNETENAINAGPGDYRVTTVDANGCEGTDNISIASLDLPTISIHAGRTTIKAGDTTQLVASGGVSYVWDTDETLSATNVADPIASPVETTQYHVTGTGENGCAGDATVSITVSGTLGFPPAFSPNGDGDNEIWNIRAENTPDCTLTIYDGNGSKIFQKMGQNWDGTYQGKVVPSGTYYYVFGCPNEKAQTGSVLVFK